MLNSLLMLGSTNKKSGKWSYLFVAIWIIYMLMKADFESGIVFIIANIVAFAIVFALGKIVAEKYGNMAISILSVLIWSTLIDIVCFVMYPEFAIGKNIIEYVGAGVLFNCRYVLLNAIVVSAICVINICVKRGVMLKSEK